jgi:hypothetical protein
VQCAFNAPGYDWNSLGSGFFRGQGDKLTAGLKSLDPKDNVGVVHWCDTGTFGVDLFPTPDRDAPAGAIQEVLTLPPVSLKNAATSGRAPSGRGVRGGASAGAAYIGDSPTFEALGNMIDKIGDLTRLMTPDAVPVVIFLYGDHGGGEIPAVGRLLAKAYAQSAIIYVLNNGAVPTDASRSSETRSLQMYYVHYLAEKTGGRAVEAFHGEYAQQISQIAAELQNRYELRFTPATLDGNQHDLRLRLTSSARSRLGSLTLNYSAGYVASSPAAPSPQSQMEAALVEALRSHDAYPGIGFDASGRVPSPQVTVAGKTTKTAAKVALNDDKSTQTALFKLYVDANALHWRRQVKTSSSGEVVSLLTANMGVAVASLSTKGAVLSTQSGMLEAHRTEAEHDADRAATSPKAVLLNVEFSLPTDAASVRFVLRDADSGQIGSFEMSVTRIAGYSTAITSTKAAAQPSN